jgi:hypothetical protein
MKTRKLLFYLACTMTVFVLLFASPLQALPFFILTVMALYDAFVDHTRLGVPMLILSIAMAVLNSFILLTDGDFLVVYDIVIWFILGALAQKGINENI